MQQEQLFERASGPRIAIVAGEASGDLLGASLVAAIKRRLPDAQFAGIAGPQMQAEGVKSICAMERLSVMGYVEVLKHLPSLLRLRRDLKKRLLRERPDVFIGVDAPDFNFSIEKTMRSAGIPSLHYISPSIWAWRPKRINKIRKSSSEVLCVFPFEKPIYDRAGLKASYVGHPVADEMPVVVKQHEVRELIGVGAQQKVLAFLPGSRQSEVARHAELFIQTAKMICATWPTAQILVPLVTRETRVLFENAIYAHKAQDLPIRMMFGHAQEAMQAADAILVASGTATLEAMLAKRPMVVTYKLSPTTYRMAKRKMLLPYVSLPNVLAGEFIVPEFIQDDATPENLYQALRNALEDRTYAAKLEARFTELHQSLKQNAAERAADAVLAWIRR
ncbi:lipid-A-disaccharide synthase [Burkholderiaceae bacterium DAT-1]|nr:lipid-A-disaccharide synthase [Burkholderiaceae bacterium DAT-1]